MSKTLARAAMIVGAVGLIATGIGSAAGAGLLGAAAQTAAAAGTGIFGTLATVATVASVAAGALGLAAGLSGRKPAGRAPIFTPHLLESSP